MVPLFGRFADRRRYLPVRAGVFAVALSLIGACATSPKPAEDVFSEHLTLFSHGGYDFAAKVEKGILKVRVPCCQTYTADLAFRDLLLEAVSQRLGCAPVNPIFTDGWIGDWQMRAVFACGDGSKLEMILVAGDADIPA